jgi:hypothetical protein
MFLTIKYKNAFIYIANESGKKERIEIITSTSPPIVYNNLKTLAGAKRLITKLQGV